MSEWKVKKPDKNGYWLWRFTDGKYPNIVGHVLVNGDSVRELSNDDIAWMNIEVWWNICEVETFYVEGA
jgi:hypothetical protein